MNCECVERFSVVRQCMGKSCHDLPVVVRSARMTLFAVDTCVYVMVIDRSVINCMFVCLLMCCYKPWDHTPLLMSIPVGQALEGTCEEGAM